MTVGNFNMWVHKIKHESSQSDETSRESQIQAETDNFFV